MKSAADVADERDIRRTLDALYTAFSFNAGTEPDWITQRALFLPGAAFVDRVTPGSAPRAIGVEEFVANFRRWVMADSALRDGFRERIMSVRMDHFGHVAHAYVAFEGFVPEPGVVTPPPRTRGVDSIQLVRDDHGRWHVASFTTQYEGPAAPLPARFGGRSGGWPFTRNKGQSLTRGPPASISGWTRSNLGPAFARSVR